MGADRADDRVDARMDDPAADPEDAGGTAGRRRRRTAPGVAHAVMGIVLLAGCASMPDSGDLRGVESTPRQDAQVRVFAVPPRDGASQPEIVQGFLEALTSDDPNYDTARTYLTRSAAKNWRPEGSVTVLANDRYASAQSVGSREDADEYGMTVVGTKVATLDEQNAYMPGKGEYRGIVHLVRDRSTGGQWRIDRLPPGIVMGQSDFVRNYVSVNKYYFASGTAGDGGGQPVAVADPVYVRKQVDPMTSVVRSLLAGPTRWLGGVVRSAFPAGTALDRNVRTLTPDEQNKLTVPLNSRAKSVGSSRCAEIAAQLYYTLQDLTPTGVEEVELRSGGRRLCAVNEDRAQSFSVTATENRPEYQYLLDARRRLVRLPAATKGTETEPVPGALGNSGVPLSSAAVSRDEDMAAGVSDDGSLLYVGSLASGGSLGEPMLRSRGKSIGDRLTAPSWDSSGNLWIADRDPDRPRLLLFEQGEGRPLTVDTSGLDGRIEAVRVAADGVRIALIVKQADGRRTLQVGRIERDSGAGTSADGTTADGATSDGTSAAGATSDGDGRALVSVAGLRLTAPQFEDVSAMSWAGESRLVVVGREEGGVQQMSYVQADGSTPAGQAPAALTGVKEIAAADDAELPLLAWSSEDGIVRLPSGTQWQKIIKDGTAPVYPG